MKKSNLMASIIIIASLSIYSDETTAQVPIIEWDKTFGGSSIDVLTDLQQTTGGSILQPTIDGGYILGGFSRSGISGDKTGASRGRFDYWIVKTDAVGNKIFDKTFGGSDQDFLRAIQQTNDGGYILGGGSASGISGDKTTSAKGDFHMWVIKTDAQGNKVWENTYGGTGSQSLKALQQTTDGGYILGGSTSSGSNGDITESLRGSIDFWIVKIDSVGNKEFDKIFGGNKIDALRTLIQTNDGGYIFGGVSQSDVGGDKSEPNRGNNDWWIVKTDADGNKIFDKTFGGSSQFEELASIQQTTDGGYILGGRSGSGIGIDKSEPSRGSDDMWIIKIDADGNKIFDKTFGGSGSDGVAHVLQTPDGGYIIGGRSTSDIDADKSEPSKGGTDYWIVKTDVNGNKEWDKTIGGSGEDNLATIQKTTDGGYILGGNSFSGISGDKTEPSRGSTDYWIVKLIDCSIAGRCGTISGTIYVDPDSSCSLTPGDIAIGSVKILAEDINGTKHFAFSDISGVYSFALAPGTYTITLVHDSLTQEPCIPDQQHIVNLSVDQLVTGNDLFIVTPPPSVVNLVPASNSTNVAPSGAVEVTFNLPVDTTSFNDTASFIVYGNIRGRYSGTFTFNGNNTIVTFTPGTVFKKGEEVNIIVSDKITDVLGSPLLPHILPHVSEFTVAFDPSPGLFAVPVQFPTGNFPANIAAGDLNTNGFVDLTVTNLNDNTISILLNDINNPGTFLPKIDVATLNDPYDIKIRDLNNDNAPDIVVTNRGAGSFSVFLNDGNGNFPSRDDYPSGNVPHSIDINDIDGDGNVDIIVSHFESPASPVAFKGNGDGTFFNDGIRRIAAHIKTGLTGDIDNDGDMDIIASANANRVKVIKNDGDGNYNSGMVYKGNTDFGSRFDAGTMDLTDIDGDGDLDILVGARAPATTITIFTNKGNGIYSRLLDDVQAGFLPHHVVTADIDGDGDMDIIAAHELDEHNRGISVLSNNGNGTFAESTEYIADTTQPEGILVADIDNNGTGDLIVTNTGSSSISVLKNVIDPAFIAGKVFYDLNENAIFDSPDDGIANSQLQLLPNEAVAITDAGGNYEFIIADTGTYTVVSERDTSIWERTLPVGQGNYSNLSIVQGQTISNRDFAYFRKACPPDPDNCLTSTVQLFNNGDGNPFPCPGNVHCYEINVTNGCGNPGGVQDFCTTLELDFANNIASISSLPPCPADYTCTGSAPTAALCADLAAQGYTCTVTGAGTPVIIEWCNNGIFGNGSSFTQVVCVDLTPSCIISSPPCTNADDAIIANLNSTGTVIVLGTPCSVEGGDASIEDADCAFDPNNKLVVTPEGCGLLSYIEPTDTLHYRINFQNTGTAPASFVKLLDTLDADLDISALNLLGSSHTFTFQVINGNILEWVFSPIFLPDSSVSQDSSRGFVEFSILSNQNISPGSAIINQAGIIFDGNEPVLTNETYHTISITPPPIAGISEGDRRICSGDTATFTASDGDSYLWNTGETTRSIKATQAGIYTVRIFYDNACESSASAALTVNPIPAPALAAGGPLTFCEGDSVTLDAGSFSTYLWSNNNTTRSITVTESGNFHVAVTDAIGCPGISDTVTVTVLPNPVVDAGDCQTVFFGYAPEACADLSASVSGGTPPYTYLWSTGETTPNITVCPAASIVFTVIITDANGCMGTDDVTVEVVDVRCGHNLDKVQLCHFPPGNPSNSISLCINPGNVANHLADHNDELGACGTPDPCIQAKWSGTATLGNDETEVYKDEQTGELPGLLDKDGYSLQNTTTIFPNPNNGEFMLIMVSVKKEIPASVYLYNTLGKVIFQQEHLRKNYLSFNISGLPKGIYFVKVIKGGDMFMGKIIHQ